MDHAKQAEMYYFNCGSLGCTRKSNSSEFIYGKENNQFS